MSAPEAELFTGIVPFVAIAEARSFRQAARQLGVTASAVSKAVTKLEADLGVRLLHRTSRSVTLTVEGDAFLQTCREAVDKVRAARETAAQGQRVPGGLLRVSMPLALGKLVMRALPRLLSRYPALRMHIMLTDRFVQLMDENVDIVVRVGVVEASSLVARRLRAVRWITAASPAYVARHGTPKTPGELSAHNCLKFVRPNGLPQEWTFHTAGATSTVRTQGILTADHGDALIEAAVAGLGIVQAPDFMVAAEIASGELREVLTDHAAPGPPMSVLRAPGRHSSPNIRAFTAFLIELIGV